ncbi:TetR family transcriptional regulator [Nocardioides sp. NPDC000445]|uniref:TetR/AcrR family transcriptional regulator n=1 Tax=Nocardioides TaxID=1839 RepID=UPI0015CAA331
MRVLAGRKRRCADTGRGWFCEFRCPPATAVPRPTRPCAPRGFAETSPGDVADEARGTRVVLYRHFDSKAELCRTILDRARERLAEHVGTDDFEDDAIPALLDAAAEGLDAFACCFAPPTANASSEV